MRATPEQVLGSSSTARDRQRLIVALQRSAGNAAVNRLLRDIAPPAPAAEPQTQPSGAPARLVADDGPEPQTGQLRISDFFARLQPAVCSIAEARLGDQAQGCPWAAYWIASYRSRTPAEVEQTIVRYAPDAAGAISATDLIAAVCDRVSQGIENWQRTGQMDAGIADVGAGAVPTAGAPTAAPRIGFLRSEDPPAADRHVEASEVISTLGPGHPLDARLATRMGSAFGADFATVRVHDDPDSAATTAALGAHALAVGEHIAFAPNMYEPGTPIGDALIAHELAHVIQQGNGAWSTATEAGLEADANIAAASALDVLYGGPAGQRGLGPALGSGLRLQRCNTSSAPPAPAPPVSAPPPAPPPPVASGRDQRRGTGELTAGQLHDIQNEIFPGAAPAPGSSAPRLWDGRTGAPNFAQNRTKLRREMLDAMGRFLDAQMVDIRRSANTAVTPRATIAQLAGPGHAAKRQVDALFGDYASNAALTAPQFHVRGSFTMRPGTDLIDRTDPAQFTTDPSDTADWIAQTAPAASAAQQRHALVKDRSAEERDWLANEVVAPFTSSRRTDLDLFDRFGFLDTTRLRISVLPTLTSGGSNSPGPGGRPSDALRRQQWSTWQLLVHEYIHTLEHPAFEAARGGNRVLFEGFCEYFALQVRRQWVPIIKADTDQATRKEVEGTDPAGAAWPGFDPKWIDTPDAGAYAQYVAHVEAIRNRIGAGGEEALRGAFFQGHIELIGLESSGTVATTPVHLNDDVHVPAGITDRAALAAASHVPESEITRDNPGLPATAIPAGTPVHLTGCREHVVVQAPPTFDVPAGSPTSETPAQIATQNGITEAALRAANPGVSWSTIGPGDKLLIPRH